MTNTMFKMVPLFIFLTGCMSVVHKPSGLEVKRYGLRNEVTITETDAMVTIVNGDPVMSTSKDIRVTGGVHESAYAEVFNQIRSALMKTTAGVP